MSELERLLDVYVDAVLEVERWTDEKGEELGEKLIAAEHKARQSIVDFINGNTIRWMNIVTELKKKHGEFETPARAEE